MLRVNGVEIKTTPDSHSQSASTITTGTFAGKVYANQSAIADITDYQVRNIAAHSVDASAGTTPLADGYIYLVYE